jgi:hypothetical protein
MATFQIIDKSFKRIATGFNVNLAGGAIAAKEVQRREMQATYDTFPKTEPDTKDLPKSILDTPVYSNLQFGTFDKERTDKNKYIDLQGVEQTFQPLSIDTVLMDVSLPKNIIKTQIQGKAGDFKQYVSSGDYVIRVTGKITPSSKYDNTYPEDDVKKLIDILNIPDSIPVSSDFLNLFDISRVVIDSDANLVQEQGVRTNQSFTFTMVSDTEINLEEVETA